jgi:hypothetical protein
MKYWVIILIAFPLLAAADVSTKEISRDRVLSEGPEWQQNYDNFKPDPGKIEALKEKTGTGLSIDIYLGFWCPDSRKSVPPFLRIIESAGSAVPVRYISVARKPVKQIRYFVDAVQVERVPTFIFYREDKEIGRIVEHPQAGLIEDTMAILSK